MLYDFAASSPIALIALGTIVLCGTLGGLLMSFILINRARLQYQERRDERLIAKHEDSLFEILIGEQKRLDPRAYRFAVDQLRIAFSGSAVRALKETMVLLGRDLSGENMVLLHELYQDLRLDQPAIRMLQKGNWGDKITAVKELGHFGVTHAIPHLNDLTEDPHETVRGEAQCALLRLGGAAQLDFLATLNQPITRWQQIRLVNVLKRFDQDKLPDFQLYLTNPNESVTLFVLQLIRLYNQTHARDMVVEKLFDPRPTVQREAIKTVSGWLDQDVVELLMILYAEGAQPVHVSVVQALRQWMYDKDTRHFLEDVAENTEDYTLRMNALRSLKLLGGDEAIMPLSDTPDETIQRCVTHQLDHRI